MKTTPKYYCPECSEYLGNSHRAACSRHPDNQVKYPTHDWHRNIMTVQAVDKSGFKLDFDVHSSILLSRDPSEWEAEAKTANENRCMVLMHPKFLLDLLASLDAARKENEDLRSRFAEAVKKLKG